jgi:endoglucanase
MKVFKVCLCFFLFGRTLGWTVENGQIYKIQKLEDTIEKSLFRVKGLSWFGFETQDYVVDGLWQHPMDTYLDQLQSLKVTTLRVPFSAEWIQYNFDLYPYDGFTSADPENQHKKSIEILDTLFDKCEERNIFIMLDLHRLHNTYISELWYSPTDKLFTAESFFSVWETMLTRYAHRPNFFGVDLLNEPHGSATWGTGNTGTDWNLFVEYAIPILGSKFPNDNFLFIVEGIEWGHTFHDYTHAPLNVPGYENRIIFSPHSYGRSVVPGTSSDPHVLYQNWDNDYGFLRTQHSKTVVPGEWGGRTDLDADWMSTFVSYLIERNMTNNFLWSLGPNSGDVQGLLLDDWTTIDEFKKGVMERLIGF